MTTAWMIAFFVLLALAIGTIAFVTNTQKPVTQIVVVTPTPPFPTPTVLLQPNPIATTSAFMVTEARLGELTKSLNSLNITESGMYPPVLDLPLGFSR